MTTFEHAMVGVNGVLATGLHRRYGWQLVAMAGIVGISPDWDGLTLLFGADVFARAHRVWGHNLLITTSVAAVIAVCDDRFNVTTRVWLRYKRFRKQTTNPSQEETAGYQSNRHPATWLVVAVVVAWSHLLADMVVSGTDSLPDWEVQLAWPFSNQGWVWPMVQWGDPGMTILFAIGMIAMAKSPSLIQPLALLSLLSVVAYIAVRGSL